MLNTQHYKVRIKGKVEQSGGKELRPPLHLGVVSYRKGSVRVTLDYGRQLFTICTRKQEAQLAGTAEYTDFLFAEG